MSVRKSAPKTEPIILLGEGGLIPTYTASRRGCSRRGRFASCIPPRRVVRGVRARLFAGLTSLLRMVRVRGPLLLAAPPSLLLMLRAMLLLLLLLLLL